MRCPGQNALMRLALLTHVGLVAHCLVVFHGMNKEILSKVRQPDNVSIDGREFPDIDLVLRTLRPTVP